MEGGINYWLDIFEQGDYAAAPNGQGEELSHNFDAALGSNQQAAEPDEHALEHVEFTPKVKLSKKVKRQGGCG